MSYASGTTHYNLPQTVGSDKRDWTDTNQAFSDIDAAIYGAAQGASAATSAIQTINGQIETITAAQAVDEGNISTLAGKVSTLESTVGTQAAAIADVRQDLQDNIESKREASATSTHAYEIGDTFYYNDVLYKATAQIAIGGTIVPSTNCTAVTVMSEIDQLNSDLTELMTDVASCPSYIGSRTTSVASSAQSISYTATSNGYIYILYKLVLTSAASWGYCAITINDIEVGHYGTSSGTSMGNSGTYFYPILLPVKEGDVIYATKNNTGNFDATFIY